jgi:hypothetical protein
MPRALILRINERDPLRYVGLGVIATLWPILFAAVIGPLFKAIASHRAERGTKLGVSILESG